MKTMYCWLKPDLSFSDSWDEQTHKDLFDDELKEYAKRTDWRLISFQVEIGKDFEFQSGMVLNSIKN